MKIVVCRLTISWK